MYADVTMILMKMRMKIVFVKCPDSGALQKCRQSPTESPPHSFPINIDVVTIMMVGRSAGGFLRSPAPS